MAREHTDPPDDMANDGQPSTALAITNATLLERFAPMVTMLPLETEGDMSAIFERIIDAGRWEDLDAPWESSDAEHLIGRKLILRSAKRRPSDFTEGLGFFLVMDCADYQTGEPVTAVNGSVAVIAQVVRAYAIGALPMVIEFVVADRPTKRGYHPHHLKVHDSMGTGPDQRATDG
jgi:hypothetical protein